MKPSLPNIRRFSIVFLLATVSASLFVGCGTTKISRRIEPGGFLQEQDYAELQRVAAEKPIDWPKSWAERADRIPSPKWIYFTVQGQDFRRFDAVAIPDLEVAVPEARTMAREIPDVIAKELVARKIFRTASRENRDSGLVLIGGMTSAAWGSYAKDVAKQLSPVYLAPEQHFLQVEFKIIADSKQVGAIQVYAQRAIGIGGFPWKLIQGGLAGQMADGVVESMKGLKAGIPAQASEVNCLPSNFK